MLFFRAELNIQNILPKIVEKLAFELKAEGNLKKKKGKKFDQRRKIGKLLVYLDFFFFFFFFFANPKWGFVRIFKNQIAEYRKNVATCVTHDIVIKAGHYVKEGLHFFSLFWK